MKNPYREDIFPPSKIGGPIEAIRIAMQVSGYRRFPPSKIGGPIEAIFTEKDLFHFAKFPPSKIGGPIEADIKIF